MLRIHIVSITEKARGDIIATVNPYLWAKKREVNGRYLWLPLKQHLKDTQFTADRLWELWLSKAQKQQIIQSLSIPDEEAAKKLVQFLGLVHDWGKATPAFQVQQSWPANFDLDYELLERLERAGFEGIMNPILPHRSKSHHALAGQVLLSWYGVGDDIASIIGGHHGRPIDSEREYVKQGVLVENYYQIGNSENIANQKWKRTQREFFDWALEEAGFSSVKELPAISQAGQVILSGLLIMADWLSSNEDFFSLIAIDSLEVKNQEERWTAGWRKWYQNDAWNADENPDFYELYDQRFKFKDGPRNVQERLSEVIEQTEQPGIFILEAPMGVGKTEAALVGVEQLAGKLGLTGMFFGLPTQATSDGIFGRVTTWLDRLAGDSNDFEKLSIQLMHGKAELNTNFNTISRNIDVDGEQYGNVFVNEWFSGRKKTSLDDFVVGTVDQVLLLALKQKHVALRHLGFSKKVVVIDEVHSYDAYMSEYLQSALQWLAAYEVPVIILSATLASNVRTSLIKAYLDGRGVKLPKGYKQDEKFQTTAYPLITYTDGDEIHQAKDMTVKDKKRITIEKIDEDDLLPLIDELSQHQGVIGIIANTVRRAQELAQYCVEQYGEESVELLHSNFINTHRVKKEEELLEMIGKEAVRPDQKIIIGTQVIEQSLDINFDVMISDLAPMDLLIQRVGRLHRHKMDHPVAFTEPTLYVVGTSDQFEFNGGSSVVYGDYLLARTQYFLGDQLHLPEDISPLVQAVYGEDHIKVPAELENRYSAIMLEHKQMLKNKKIKARTYKIAKPKLGIDSSVSLIGWLNAAPSDTKEELAHAQVRDIQDTIEVIALKRVGNGYGIMGEEEDLSSSITDYHTGMKIARQTLRLPFYLSGDETIDWLEKYTTKELRGWQEQPWLRGLLGIIFDENHQFHLDKDILEYDMKYGLTFKKKEKEDGGV